MKAFNDVRKMLVFNGRKFEDVFLNFDKLPEDVREDALADIYNGTINKAWRRMRQECLWVVV